MNTYVYPELFCQLFRLSYLSISFCWAGSLAIGLYLGKVNTASIFGNLGA